MALAHLLGATRQRGTLLWLKNDLLLDDDQPQRRRVVTRVEECYMTAVSARVVYTRKTIIYQNINRTEVKGGKQQG